MEKLKEKPIIISLSLYFAWLLSFPLYGPISQELNQAASTVQVFLIFSCALLFLRSLKFKNPKKEIRLAPMLALLGHLMALYLSSFLGAIIMAWANSSFILAWGYFFTKGSDFNNRHKYMAVSMIISNIILALNYLLLGLLDIKILAPLSSLPLILLILMDLDFKDQDREVKSQEFPALIVALTAGFSFIIYLNGGIFHKFLLPHLSQCQSIVHNFSPIFYIMTLALVYRFIPKIETSLFVHLGLSSLGLSIMSFALMGSLAFSCFLTVFFIEVAFALLDIFFWTQLGHLSQVYKKPYIFFGFGLGAQLASMLSGDFFIDLLSKTTTSLIFPVAGFTTLTIFISLAFIPWLDQKVNSSYAQSWKNQAQESSLIDLLDNQSKLTKREEEVLELILEGLTNKAIAEKLYISHHTVKTHTRNIYKKFRVANKRELMSLALTKEE